jgi:hypothetical protein
MAITTSSSIKVKPLDFLIVNSPMLIMPVYLVPAASRRLRNPAAEKSFHNTSQEAAPVSFPVGPP